MAERGDDRLFDDDLPTAFAEKAWKW